MNNRIKLIAVIFILNLFCIYAQNVEKIGTYKQIQYHVYPAALGSVPHGIYFDEINNKMMFQNPGSDELITCIIINDEEVTLSARKCEIPRGSIFFKVNDDYWGLGNFIRPIINNIANDIIITGNGISFILKKDNGYIIYYVDEEGIPGAVDTTGKIYNNTEAISYLQEYDKAKFEQSRERAGELGLLNEFEYAQVLVWGQTYYSTVDILEVFWKPDWYLYPDGGNAIQYDLQGNGYQQSFWYEGDKSKIVIVSPQGKQLENILIDTYSDILQQENLEGNYSSSMYVGFGGNIYYYIAGEEYTEVFRIRRTWGEPDFYAMAINGWTDDDYGTYVDTVLAKLDKKDLRLLRNTVFALYGYHFNSADLADYFDKQVWYTDNGLTVDQIQLPEHRLKFIEKIKKLEAGS